MKKVQKVSNATMTVFANVAVTSKATNVTNVWPNFGDSHFAEVKIFSI